MELIDPAQPADLTAITALLDACALPSVDVAPHLPHFVVAREASHVVGAIGLEVHGRSALLRSLAVAADRRGHGIALRLYASALGVAQRLGIEDLYCLTTTAQGFFELLGWRIVSRDEVPAEIRRSREFEALCPASAICMWRRMPRPG